MEKQPSFIVWLQMSAMELDRYSKTVSQVFFMLNLATYGFKKWTPPMKLQIDNEAIDTSLKTFNTYQTTGECRIRFWHSSHQTFSAWVLILKAIRPCVERVWLWQANTLIHHLDTNTHTITNTLLYTFARKHTHNNTVLHLSIFFFNA